MTEDEARGWIEVQFGSAAVVLLERYARLLIAENERQNLIAPSTIDSIWVRHIVDSAQLVTLAKEDGRWMDIGTGAGFPGLVVAMLRPAATLLVEPRRRRAEFLAQCAALLGLAKVKIRVSRVEDVAEPVGVISARAVASVEKLLQAAAGCGTTHTRWLLPRGKHGLDDIGSLQQRWRGLFHMKQSLTDPASTILICDGPLRR